MKIRSVLLGSLAAVGLSTAGFAADLGVVTSLDICDELGLSGLTISSDDNCLVITGGVEFEYSIGDYAGGPVYAGGVSMIDDNTTVESDLEMEAWLKFVATADSDFGPATATIKIGDDSFDTTNPDVDLQEAWVGIGDTTVIMVGMKDSIFNDGDDDAFDYLGLFGGVGPDDDLAVSGPATGDFVMQVVSNLGNGVSIGGGLENLQTSSPANWTAVGVLAYAGDGITAHVSTAVDNASFWNIHAGFTGAWDPIKVAAAVSANSLNQWEALASAAATFDMFTLAGTINADDAGNWGAGGSLAATVTDGVTLNLGGRYFDGVGAANETWQVEAGVSAAVTETLTLTAAVGAISSTNPAPDAFYGKAGLAWAPGGGFTSSVEGEVTSLGGYKATFKAAKDIK